MFINRPIIYIDSSNVFKVIMIITIITKAPIKNPVIYSVMSVPKDAFLYYECDCGGGQRLKTFLFFGSDKLFVTFEQLTFPFHRQSLSHFVLYFNNTISLKACHSTLESPLLSSHKTCCCN